MSIHSQAGDRRALAITESGGAEPPGLNAVAGPPSGIEHRGTVIDPFIAHLPSPTFARIDLAAFRHNIEVVRSFVSPGTGILAMVKANAYGHGMLAIAAEAAAAGVEFFGIARVEEGAELRQAGFAQRILLLELASGDRALAAIRLGLEITVASLSQATELNALARQLGRPAFVHVEIDTGMGRTGFDHARAAAEIEEISGLQHVILAGVFSHFASSDDPDQSFAHEQLKRFNGVLARLERQGVRVPLRHCANSGAIMTLPQAHFDMVRVGIMLYGYVSANGMDTAGLAPVMSLHSSVGFIKTVEAGTPISYDHRYVTPHRSRIATVLIGYGDGFSRRQTTGAEALIRGRRYPVVGTICMDMIMVDVGLEDEIAVGDTVTLIGDDGKERITAWDVARRTGTIPYEVTCQVAERVPRLFVNASVSRGGISTLVSR